MVIKCHRYQQVNKTRDRLVVLKRHRHRVIDASPALPSCLPCLTSCLPACLPALTPLPTKKTWGSFLSLAWPLSLSVSCLFLVQHYHYCTACMTLGWFFAVGDVFGGEGFFRGWGKGGLLLLDLLLLILLFFFFFFFLFVFFFFVFFFFFFFFSVLLFLLLLALI